MSAPRLRQAVQVNWSSTSDKPSSFSGMKRVLEAHEVTAAVRVLAVDEKVLRHDQMEIILCGRSSQQLGTDPW
jgi:hypothetical protein